MQFENLGDALLLTPRVFTDERGFFFESWNQQSFNELLSANSQSVVEFLQDNHSRSCRGVLRGLHYQLPPMLKASWCAAWMERFMMWPSTYAQIPVGLANGMGRF